LVAPGAVVDVAGVPDLVLLEHAAAAIATAAATTASRNRGEREVNKARSVRRGRASCDARRATSLRGANATTRYARPMVKVRVDADLCVGHGRCYVLAPDVFGTDDFGHSVVLAEQTDDALRGQAQLGADNCPEQAITIE
jgi:ferredoxin